MAIKYKVIEKSQPGIAGGGVKKWYASLETDGELTIDDLVKAVEKFSALSEADIKGVIVALENVMQTELANGKIIRLEKMGSFYPSLSSEGVANKADFNSASHIKAIKVNYRAGKRINSSLNNATLKRS